MCFPLPENKLFFKQFISFLSNFILFHHDEYELKFRLIRMLYYTKTVFLFYFISFVYLFFCYRHQKEREDLEKNMTIKLDRKKESLTRKLLEQERAATADLVEKHSKEMLNLINEKRTEFVRVRNLSFSLIS